MKNLTFELKLAYTYPLKASGGTHRKVSPTFFFIPLWSGDPMATYIQKSKQSVTNTPPYQKLEFWYLFYTFIDNKYWLLQKLFCVLRTLIE